MEIGANNPVPTNPALLSANGNEKAQAPGQKAEAPKFSEIWGKIQQKGETGPRKDTKKALGKDDFMKIMLEQLKNQDPTKPMDADKMAQQLAELGSMEQLQNIHNTLNKMSTANQPLEKLAMTNLIGKSVFVDSTRFNYDEGGIHNLSFQLKVPADQLKISVIDASSGKPIFSKDLGKHVPGNVDFSWDGKLEEGGKAKSGNYRLQVNAVDVSGKSIDVVLKREERVIGVSYEGKEPALLVGDAKSKNKVLLSSITGILDENSAASLKPSSASQSSSIPLPAHVTNPDLKNSANEEVAEKQSFGPVVPRAQDGFFLPSVNNQEDQAAAPEQPTGFPNGLKGGEG